jgi:hypothetical protein
VDESWTSNPASACPSGPVHVNTDEREHRTRHSDIQPNPHSADEHTVAFTVEYPHFLRWVVDREDALPQVVVTDKLDSYPPSSRCCLVWSTCDTRG